MLPKLFLAAALMIVFTACNNADTTSANTETVHEHAQPHDTAMHNHEAKATHGLSLNNGAKWQTDESTRKHAATLNNMVGDFEKQTVKSLSAHHSFADKMQEALQQLINDCTMEGPDHNALHLWLEPVLNDVKHLKNTDNEEEAKNAATVLSEDVRKFNQYFN
jgi:hypothetical protein